MPNATTVADRKF